MGKTVQETLDATATNDMTLREVLEYYQKPTQYLEDDVSASEMVKDLRAIADILFDGEREQTI